MADFAPYQDITPEHNRALSPPPRSPPPTTKSPPAEHPHSRGVSKNIGTAAVHAPTPTSPSSQRPGDYFPPGGGWRDEEERGDGGGGSDAHEHEGLTSGVETRGRSGRWGGGREDVDLFETRLGIRMDWEACLAYLLLPPVGGVALLILEQTSDYVRFHAWQSSLLFTFLFVVHVIFSWSIVLSWILFLGNVALIAWLTLHAYRDATTLDRYEVPFFGPLASSILDGE